MDKQIERVIERLGLALPHVAPAVGSYVPALAAGGMLFISGQLPWEGGQIAVKGKLGGGVSIEEGTRASRLAALNGLAQAKAALGGFGRLERCVRVAGYVNAVPDFTDHAKVLNGASELLLQILGEQGRHTRIAVGAGSLPLDAAVEIEFLFAVS